MAPEARLDRAFMVPGISSFADFLGMYDPTLLPNGRPTALNASGLDAPHGTTIVAATYNGGVVMAGDRRATMGNVIAQRDIEKVFPADEWSCVGIAGTAGIAVELVRLFQVELEHYEKIEGVPLSVDGKANRLSALIRNNLGLAMQGLAVVPLFAGYDNNTRRGRIFSYDVTGGRYEEHAFHAVGSGSLFARGSMKKLYSEGMTDGEVVRLVVEALYDAADDDSATGGPDLARGIVPVIALVDDNGYRRMDDEYLLDVVRSVVNERQRRPDGPHASMGGTQ